MNMHWLDWLFIVALLGAIIGITLYVRKYMRSVADFLAADRLAGRYLLTVCGGFGGAISLVAMWEMVYGAGLPTQWWGLMSIPIGLFLSLTGFVVYRFRQTRALTLAQFFEMRYSRRFRFFAGILCWISGILNYGIFPAVTANFIIYFFGFPTHFQCCGITFSTFAVVMLAYLSIACYIACCGGMISIMLTDFFQGMLLMMIFLGLMFFLLWKFSWGDIMDGLEVVGAGKSMIDPFKSSAADEFSIWYFLIGIFGSIYNIRSWQGNSGFNAAPRTPHEAKMSGVIGSWRTTAQGLCMLLIPLSAYAVMHLPAFAAIADPVNAKLAAIADPQIRNQMTVPLFLAQILPVGMMGLFAAIIVSCAISCDDTYIHAWGTIFIQDVVLPLRKKSLTPKQHLLLLRIAILSVAAFGFTFSLLFPLKDYILMYFALTGAIYLGGAGAVILGGLYWKRGTVYAAWVALISGTVLAFGGMVIQQMWRTTWAPLLLRHWPDWQWVLVNQDKFPLSSQVIYFIAMVVALASYVLVSLLGPRQVHNMDKLLHRGAYAVNADTARGDEVQPQPKARFSMRTFLGITSEFTWFDRFIAWATFYKSMLFWVCFLVGCLLYFTTDWLTDRVWREFWWWKLVAFSVVLGTICTFWITIGGIHDAIRLFKDLKLERIDEADDGTVKEHERSEEAESASGKEVAAGAAAKPASSSSAASHCNS